MHTVKANSSDIMIGKSSPGMGDRWLKAQNTMQDSDITGTKDKGQLTDFPL